MNKITYSLASLITLLLIGCGGSSSNSFNPASLSGDYFVEATVLERSGSCAFVSFDSTSFISSSTIQVERSEEIVTADVLDSPFFLKGELTSNGFKASGGVPLGGTGAASLDTSWEYIDDSTYSVSYAYSEGFISGAGCTIEAMGTARKVA